MKTLYVLDIDGTLANSAARFENAGPEPSREDKPVYIQWVEKVMTSLDKDIAVPGMADMAHALTHVGEVVYVTSREDKWRELTRVWLVDNDFPYEDLYMRETNSWMETAEMKKLAIEIARHRLDCNNVVVIDDDEHGTIEAMCKEQGYTFLRARSGGQK